MSLGPGFGVPGVAINVGGSVGTSPCKVLSGWSTSFDGNYGVGGGWSFSNSGGGTVYGQVGTPGAGFFTTYGWKL